MVEQVVCDIRGIRAMFNEGHVISVEGVPIEMSYAGFREVWVDFLAAADGDGGLSKIGIFGAAKGRFIKLDHGGMEFILAVYTDKNEPEKEYKDWVNRPDRAIIHLVLVYESVRKAESVVYPEDWFQAHSGSLDMMKSPSPLKKTIEDWYVEAMIAKQAIF